MALKMKNSLISGAAGRHKSVTKPAPLVHKYFIRVFVVVQYKELFANSIGIFSCCN